MTSIIDEIEEARMNWRSNGFSAPEIDADGIEPVLVEIASGVDFVFNNGVPENKIIAADQSRQTLIDMAALCIAGVQYIDRKYQVDMRSDPAMFPQTLPY